MKEMYTEWFFKRCVREATNSNMNHGFYLALKAEEHYTRWKSFKRVVQAERTTYGEDGSINMTVSLTLWK